MLKPFIPVILGADGVSLYVGCSCLNVTDVCSLVPLIGLVAVFLWLRGVRWLHGVVVLSALFLLNLVRVFVVALVLARFGLGAAIYVHDIAYAAFTIVTVGVVAYCAIPWPHLCAHLVRRLDCLFSRFLKKLSITVERCLTDA